MILPLGDAPNTSESRPWVNYALIAANVLVYAWAVLEHPGEAAYQAWVRDWGFVPVAPRLETFFTSMFMHGGLGHLAGNMLFLWIFGDNVEGRLGHLGYLLAYLASGLAAVILFRGLAPASTVPLVGASGAIFGVEGFYFLAFPRNQVRIVYWILIIGSAWIPARLVLGAYFVLNLLYTLTPQRGMGGGVAYAAHVGGFGAGLLLALLSRASAPRGEAVPRDAGVGSGEAAHLLARARQAAEAGDWTGAERALSQVLERHLYAPEAPAAALALGRIRARALGDPRGAREPLRFAARLHPDPQDRAAALEELRGLDAP